MELIRKLTVLADAAKYDASCASSGGERRDSRDGRGLGSTTGMGICHSYAPDGRCISLLKVLLTNFCIYDCRYCNSRRSANVPRARFTVDEVVGLTIDFYRRNTIEGLFLSSGIIRDSDYTMEQLIAVARRLRQDHDFRGYIHLKTIPEASAELLAEAGRWADRLSINLELPTPEALVRLAPEKDAGSIQASMGRLHGHIEDARAARRERRALLPVAGTRRAAPPRYAPAGQSTQMIIGADASDDATILATSSRLYQGLRMRRVYYSAYSPIPDASAELPPAPPPLWREHRLYQADWLMRFYGFTHDEIIPAGQQGRLALDIDPKLAWALAHPEAFPVDLNRAPRERLLRVPGLGTVSVGRILSTRRHRRLRLADLEALHVPAAKVLPFVLLADHVPRTPGDSAAVARRLRPEPVQGDLFAEPPPTVPGRPTAAQPPRLEAA